MHEVLNVQDFPLYDDFGTLGSTGLCLVLMGLFWLPGFLWASWLHRREQYHWTFRCLAGFAWSMALFGACTWPFLWYGLTMPGVMQVVIPVWIIFLGIGLWCGWRLKQEQQKTTNSSSPLEARVTPPLDSPATIPDETTPMSFTARLFLFPLLLYVLVCLICATLTAKEAGKPAAEQESLSACYGILVVLAICGCLLCMMGRRILQSWLRFTTTDDRPPSCWLRWLAVAFVIVQAASAMVFDRPDWDDCYYCALMLDYAESDESEPLNYQEPTHREGFQVDGHNRVLVWELWGGVLCRLSGLNPMVVAHTLWAGLLALLAYCGMWQAVKECVPRRWVPLAMLGICAYFFWGISSHNTMSNFLLVRLWQGKAVLIHLTVPLMVVAQMRFMWRPDWPGWFLLLATTVFGLAVSSTGIFLLPMLGSALCWAWLGQEVRPLLASFGRVCVTWLQRRDGPDERVKHAAAVTELRNVARRQPWKKWGVVIAGCVAALLPAVAYGLLIRSAVIQAISIQVGEQPYSATKGFAYMLGHIENGSWELVWFLLLPVLWMLLPRRWALYPVTFSVVYVLTWANPALTDPIAKYLTNYWVYFRVFWLLPVWIGIGLTLVLLTRLCAQALTVKPGPGEWLAAGLVLVCLRLSCFLPGTYVWGSANLGFYSDDKPHHQARNPYKMPPGLKELADHLLQDPDVRGSKVRLLCIPFADAATNYLTPYHRSFRFVITRELYTVSMCDQSDAEGNRPRRAEGIKRWWLYLLRWGYIPKEPDDPPLGYEVILPPYYQGIPPEEFYKHQPMLTPVLKEYLNELRVKYLVVQHDNKRDYSWQYAKVGFRHEATFGIWQVWRRDVGPRE
jgi:hypothetical protein